MSEDYLTFDDSLLAMRQFFARYVSAAANENREGIRLAFETVDRLKFVGSGPWQIAVPEGYISTEYNHPCLIYQDILIGLIPEKGINTGIPSMHARALSEANPQIGDTVIQIGAGSGYYTAILAHLVGTTGLVYAYEVDFDLFSLTSNNLRNYNNVKIFCDLGLKLLPKADVIYVCAGASHPADIWLDALKPGARLVMPLTDENDFGCMILIQFIGDDRYAARIFSKASFVPCLGVRDTETAQNIGSALKSGNPLSVKSLQRNNHPDASAWCIGKGWWLSSKPA